MSKVADAAVREQALDPARSFIVQAPAGSGKTELLTRRYLRLLAVVRQPEQILAITFTRKAAAEMRSRILKALQLGASEQPPAEEHRLITWQLARAARAADQRHGWRLEEHPARLRVQTIDALNHELARQLPILSGAGAALRIADDAEPLYAEAVLRVVEHLGEAGPATLAIERLVRHLDNRLDTFAALLTDLLRRRDHWLDLDLLHNDRAALLARLETALGFAIAGRLKQLAALWPADTRDEALRLACIAARYLGLQVPEHPLAAWQARTYFPHATVEELHAWNDLAGFLLTDKGQWRKRFTREHGFPPDRKDDKEAVMALIERLARLDEELDGELSRRLGECRKLPAARYSTEQREVLAALLEVLKLAAAELELVFREQGEADHVAAALAGRLALGSSDNPTDLALKLDARLQHLLVDEFQDTSRSQTRLLRLLTAGWSRGDGRSLFLVGDPMQSIYRFREADVGLFLKLRQEGLGELALTPLTLTVNFRSTRPVLDWVNHTFRHVLPARDDPERGAVRYTPSEPRPEVSDLGGVHLHPLVGQREATRRREAQLVAELAQAARERDPDARIAILVASRSHLADILPELTARQLRYQAVDIDPLRNRPVVQDLLALTRALVHPADRTAWLAVLRAPWCGLTLRDLHALAAETPQRRRLPTTVWSLMTDAERVARLSEDGQQRLVRLREVLATALAERGRLPLRDWIERAWHALAGPAITTTAAELSDAESLLARLDRLERAGDLEDVARLELEISGLYAAPDSSMTLPDDSPPLEIMTVHKAKGLEFDTVILPALERTAAKDEPPLLRWLELPRADDRPALLVAPMAAKETDADPLHAWLGSLEKERAAFEKGRQLYVAATRAVRELHLIGAVLPAEEDADNAVKEPPADSFLRLLWPQIRASFAAAPVLQSPAAASVADNAATLRRLPLAWIPDFNELAAAQPESAVPVIEGTLLPEFDWVSETGRHVGTIVHREVDRLARIGLAVAAFPDDAAMVRYERELAELGVPIHLRADAAQRVRTALTNMLVDERGRWLLAGTDIHREAASELALSGFIRETFVNGVIDRTFVDRAGTRWIVDFKTSVHAGAARDEFLDREVERYRPQLARYAALVRAWRPAEPVRAALYFPLLQAWREVDVDTGTPGPERVMRPA